MAMEALVFFGKGGIGKSTICANLSALFALSGKNVLHVGCDPKHDSTIAIAKVGVDYVKTFMEKVADNDPMGKPEEIALKGRFGIDIIEAGGPAAGVGCAGRGISLMLETFKEAELLKEGRYDIAMYDILGDVVCGGFATPLRAGFGRKIFIVCSEELMSIYAANNIAKAVLHYSPNGIRLGGLIANIRDHNADLGPLVRFAGIINTHVLQFIPRDPAVRDAEFRRETVVEFAPKSRATKALASLAVRILAVNPDDIPAPTPLSDQDFYRLSQEKFITDENRNDPVPLWNNGLIPEKKQTAAAKAAFLSAMNSTIEPPEPANRFEPKKEEAPAAVKSANVTTEEAKEAFTAAMKSANSNGTEA